MPMITVRDEGDVRMVERKVLPDVTLSPRLQPLPSDPTQLISEEIKATIDSELRAAARNRRESEANADQLRLP